MNSWKQINMNFILDLSTSVNIEKVKYNIILVIINWFNKMAYFIFMWKNLFIENLAHFIIYKLIKIHRLLAKIIIDKDLLFMIKFWKDFIHILRILWDMSIVYYSQTDSQIKRFNSLLE